MSQPTFSRGELQVLKAWKRLQAHLIKCPTWKDQWGNSVRWDQMGRDILWLDLAGKTRSSMVSMISALRLNSQTLRIEARIGNRGWQALGGHKPTLAVLKEITDRLEGGEPGS